MSTVPLRGMLEPSGGSVKRGQLYVVAGSVALWAAGTVAVWVAEKVLDANLEWLRSPSVIAPAALAFFAVALVAWRHQDREKLEAKRSAFLVFKAAQELQPEDLRFQRVEPGARLKPGFRPFHDKYIERLAVSRVDPGRIGVAGEAPKSQTTWTERALVEELRAGRGVLLIGKPIEGKTRTMFEMVRALTE
jgi:hypothetical protein